MIKQNTPEWLALRKGKIGASDAPPIMGVSPYKTAYELWQEKLDLMPDQEQTWAMKQGHIREPMSRLELEKMTGLLFQSDVKIHSTIPYLMASIDAIDVEGKVIGEIKNANVKDHAMAEAGQVPEKYFPQLMQQCEVWEKDWTYYLSCNERGNVLLTIERDDDYIKKMLKKHAEFWECVQEMKAPKMIEGRDYIQQTNSEWMSWAERINAIDTELEKSEILRKEREEIKQKMIMKAGNHNAIGGGISLSRVVKSGIIDYKAIPELQSIDLEKYRKKPSVYWRLGGK